MEARKVNSICLLLFLFGAAAAWAQCPIDCPGDLNGDCRVDNKDLAILAGSWLKDCSAPQTLPALKVLRSGVTTAEAEALAAELRIPDELLALEDGGVLFVDPSGFQKVPTEPVVDPVLIRELVADSELDAGQELSFEALDLAALRQMKPIPGEAVLEQLLAGLNKADIRLGDATPTTDHTLFEIVDLQGELLLPAVQVDTRVNFQSYFNGVPVIGPGAGFSASFDPQGVPTQLNLATRAVEAGEPAALLTAAGAAGQASKALGGVFVPEGDMKLVYYAPPLSERNVQTLVPHYDLGGTLYGAEGQQAAKLRTLIPATTDLRLVPAVDLSATVKGSLVQAEAAVSGGTRPYRFSWFSSSADLSEIPDDAAAVEYNALPRMQSGAETLSVRVTDDNGVMVQATTTVQIGLGAEVAGGDTPSKAGALRDFGVERAVSDLGAANQSGFVNRFQADGVFKRFNWSGTSSWENDFKQPPAGADTTYVDNVDILFYIGHGYGGGFTFESNNDDGYLTYQDAAGAWGNYDLEWLCLLSCQVLKDEYDGKKWWTRWGPAFDGLHLLTGFQTNAYDWSAFGGRFADYTLGRNFGFTKITLPIRAAWFQAKREEQPASVEAVVMGVVGPGNVLGGYNDYFWGKGPVSADLRGSNKRAYWRIVYK